MVLFVTADTGCKRHNQRNSFESTSQSPQRRLLLLQILAAESKETYCTFHVARRPRAVFRCLCDGCHCGRCGSGQFHFHGCTDECCRVCFTLRNFTVPSSDSHKDNHCNGHHRHSNGIYCCQPARAIALSSFQYHAHCPSQLDLTAQEMGSASKSTFAA